MKILIVTDTYPPNVNGAALATERMAVELAKRGHKVSVLAPSTSFKHYKRLQGSITIYRLRSILFQKKQDFRISPHVLHSKQLKEIAKEVDPDLIHINNPGFIAQSAISVAKEMHIPVIGTSHFMPENLTHYLHLPDTFEKMLNTSLWKWYAKFYGRLDLIISPTQTAADLLLRLKVGTKVVVISNGIDLQQFNPANSGDYLKERFSLPKKLTLLFVGRLDKEKNIDVLIRAVGRIKELFDFHTVIVGNGKEDVPLKALAAAVCVSDRITFTGYLPKKDLPNIYTVGTIFVMPSVAELQSLVTMEAMATGLPVIGANAVALPHLIHNGENGFLFEPGNDKELAEKLILILKDEKLRKRMAEKSLEIIKKHDMRDVISKIESAYQSVVKNYKIPTEEEIAEAQRSPLRPSGRKLLPRLRKIRVINHYFKN